MITYSDIEYKDNGRDDLQFEKIVKLMGRSEDISKLGEYFISSLSEGESIKCTHTKLISKIIRRLSNSEILLPITLISKQQLDEVFELFEKQLKENVFLSSNKDRLLFDLYDDEVIVDKTKEIPTQLSKDISSMGLLQMLTSGDVFVVNAGLLILWQIGLLCQNYNVPKVLQNPDYIDYVRDDIRTNIFKFEYDINPEKRKKRISLIDRFGLEKYETILKNLNLLGDYLCRLNPTKNVYKLMEDYQLLKDNFDIWPSEKVLDFCVNLFNGYKEENTRQLISSLQIIEDDCCSIESASGERLLLSFISREDTFQQEKESQLAALTESLDEVESFMTKDAFERQTERANLVSFEYSSNFTRFKVNNSNIISASCFKVGEITPHLGRKVAFGYGSKSLSNNSFVGISSGYIAIDERGDFAQSAMPHNSIINDGQTNELLLDATFLGNPTYILYVQQTPELDVSEPDYLWAMELAQKHHLHLVIYNEYVMRNTSQMAE